MKRATKPTRSGEIQRVWHLIDVDGLVLGHAAVDIAQKLMGKNKSNFVRNMDCGDHVVVTNSSKIVVTGRKDKQKLYSRYSGYPGGLKQKTFAQVRKTNPTLPVRSAVYGMLPKNKLRDRLITRLYIYPGSEHPHESKFKKKDSS